jgi:DNA-directed RNA polymerase omega subunit
MIFPKLDALEHKINSKYLLAILVAKRARQIKEETPRLPGLTQPHPITLALRELLERDIKIALDDPTLGINLCPEHIDVDELRRQAQAAYVALGRPPEPEDVDVEPDEADITKPADDEELTVEGVAGLDGLGEMRPGSKSKFEDL